MNEQIKELWYQAVQPHTGDSWAEQTAFMEKFAELMVGEFIDVLEREIGLCEQYKATASNDFDRRWQEGKIQHFHKLIDKTKKHFGVESCTN